MKKMIAIAAIGAFALGFTSCKKDYTCKCDGGNTGSIKYEFENVNKADAKAACETWDNFWTAGGGNCELE